MVLSVRLLDIGSDNKKIGFFTDFRFFQKSTFNLGGAREFSSLESWFILLFVDFSF